MNRFESLRLTAEELKEDLRKISGPVDGFFRLSDGEEAVMLHGEPLPADLGTGVPFLFSRNPSMGFHGKARGGVPHAKFVKSNARSSR